MGLAATGTLMGIDTDGHRQLLFLSTANTALIHATPLLENLSTSQPSYPQIFPRRVFQASNALCIIDTCIHACIDTSLLRQKLRKWYADWPRVALAKAAALAMRFVISSAHQHGSLLARVCWFRKSASH